MLAQMKSEWNDANTQLTANANGAENDATATPRTQDVVKNYAFKLKLFSIQKKRDKSELKDEKEASRRLLYKCPYCDKLYANVTRFEVHRRTHVSVIIYKYLPCIDW